MMSIGGGGDDVLGEDGLIRPELLPDPLTSISEVQFYADLPEPLDYAGTMFKVSEESGSWMLFNKRSDGFYESDGATWNYLGVTIERVSPSEINLGQSIGVRRYTVNDIVSVIDKHQEHSSSYETISKNLKAYPYSVSYNAGKIATIDYDIGLGEVITKTFEYQNDKLVLVVLSGALPSIINTTKTLEYNENGLSNIVYSVPNG